MPRSTETRRQNEKLLEGIQEKVRTLLNVPTDAILLLDRNGRIQILNETAAARLGKSVSELMGAVIWDFLPPDFVESARNHLDHVAQTGKPSRFEYQRGDRWSDAVIFPTAVPPGEIEYFGVAARDITDRKHAEEKIARHQVMLQQIVDGISDPLILLDAENRVQIINKKAQEYFGLPDREAAVGKTCFDGLMRRSLPCDGCEFPSLTPSQRVLEFERRGLMDPDKVESFAFYTVFDKLGNREATVIRIRDITHEKNMQKHLLRTEKLASLGLFVSAVAHEINNPNAYFALNIPVLRDYLQDLLPITDNHFEKHPDVTIGGLPYGEFRTDVFKLLENMEHGSVRINKIISNLKPCSGELRPMVACSDVKAVIEKAVEFCQPQFHKRVHSFETQVPDDLPRVVIDPDALEQILVNLILNAIQATDKEDSRIRVQASWAVEPKPQCILTVSDNGSGIQDSTKNKVFDPFFSTKRSPEGTGLGLYVCHNLVQAAGGRIEFDSRWGEGTTFRVILEGLEVCSTAD